MKILVCGGRDFQDKDYLFECLYNLYANNPHIELLIHGGARGADTLAGQWAETVGIKTVVYKAEWSTYGKAAGSIRNQLMLDSESPDVVLAFPGGNGTADMVRRSKSQGIEVIEFEPTRQAINGMMFD